jgi:hypothetical protein
MPVESARSQNITVTCRRSPTASGARYRHARLSAVKLADDINARVADRCRRSTSYWRRSRGRWRSSSRSSGRVSTWRLRASRRGKNRESRNASIPARAGWSGSPAARWTAPERGVPLRKGPIGSASRHPSWRSTKAVIVGSMSWSSWMLRLRSDSTLVGYCGR